MQLNINRFFSDRVVFQNNKLELRTSFWDWCLRIISWIWAPSCYSNENRRSIACFKKYLIDTLGPERLQRICTRYSLDLAQMERQGSPLLSRHVAQIVVGVQNIHIEDIEEWLHKKQTEAPDAAFSEKSHCHDLTAQELAQAVRDLKQSLGNLWKVSITAPRISGASTDWFARLFYDPFLADLERLEVCKEHPTDPFNVFIHNMVARVIKRDMDVGTLVPAPNHPDGHAQFYYVSGRLVTGEGMVSYLLHPATTDTQLEPIRLFRGTAPRNGELDALSTVITDFELDLGRRAYESGIHYEKKIQSSLPVAAIEAGHSLGSALVQYRLANSDHIRKAYLIAGPGVPEREVQKFNQKQRTAPVQLFIRQSMKDKWVSAGQVHLGWKAPTDVKIHFWKFYGPKKGKHSPHVTVWEKTKVCYGIEGISCPLRIESELYLKGGFREKLRSNFGPPVANLLRKIQSVYRCVVPTRTQREWGLKIGKISNGRWQVEHFRPV